jgi:cytochrome b561
MSEMSVIMFMTLMVLLMFMALATTVPSVRASRVFLILGLLMLLFNHLIYYAMMIAVGSVGFSISAIGISSLVYIGWVTLILRRHKKDKKSLNQRIHSIVDSAGDPVKAQAAQSKA